jgi:gamma-glutamylputrescine oxidase
VAALAERVRARGGHIHEHARVARIDAGPGRDRPVRLELSGGEATVIARDVVLATAGYAPDLGVMRGRILPVHLQVMATEPLSAAARDRLGWARREGVVDARRVFSYFRLTADDRVVFGGGSPRYRWGRVTDGAGAARAVADLAADLARTFPAELGLRPAASWTGVIGYVLDSLPAIGRLRDRPGLLHVGGWSGHGVALSLASGAWVADMIQMGTLGGSEDLPWFRDRPPLLPFEPLRWAAFRTAVGAMRALDQLG